MTENEQTPEPEPQQDPAALAAAVADPAPPALPMQMLPPLPEPPLCQIPAARKPRRRIKTRTLMASAVVLGLLGGAGVGYAIQSSRPPTPLPALLPAAPKYAPVGVYAGVAPPTLPPSQDDLTVTDGDLTKLLLPTPAGASVQDAWDHQWLDVMDDAELCSDDRQAECFSDKINAGVRAVADTGWTTSSGYYEEIRIFRYAPSYDTNAFLDGISSEGSPIDTPPLLDASAVADTYTEDGDHLDYGAAAHGDLAVEFWVGSTERVPDPSLIDDLMTQQMARL
ncbi:hypothetical protein [Actinospica robiniae]|uniref:hypothetical protein n=1 Tax=Actinospica robiniae TaxID=304901 RepID=UPI000400FF4C|nr:hypothetical protein [Actinospica robiniae]